MSRNESLERKFVPTAIETPFQSSANEGIVCGEVKLVNWSKRSRAGGSVFPRKADSDRSAANNGINPSSRKGRDACADGETRDEAR